ncbi:sulfotransferase [Fulvivirga ulvae]|uniref:sulfotransferase family protein n=1 Tax=Fulvivirga ulvae TaxID=2904245 RepID=UPI001F3E038F|nr:sulfotransferase [Fulvivirga ulvae]UII30193.1 sulfotransferase [Fulvivirga ulvae]
MSSRQDNKRLDEYKKDDIAESAMEAANQRLQDLHLMISETYNTPKYPVIFIVGAQRSGTTLLMQSMVNYFRLFYANNLIARFYKAPYVGAYLYKSLFKSLDTLEVGYSSDLGYTESIHGPHEFGYFWRRWFPYEAYDKNFTEEAFAPGALAHELATLEAVYGVPLVFKNITICDFNIERLARELPTALFINIERDSIYCMQSTYLSRLKMYGSDKEWIGVKPPEYPKLKEMLVFDQIAGQLHYTKEYIDASLKKISPERFVEVKYEHFVENPAEVMQSIFEMVRSNGFKIEKRDRIMPPISSTNSRKLSDADFEKIAKALRKYS